MKFSLNNYTFFYQGPASPFAEGLIDLTAILLFYFVVLVVCLCWFFFRFILIFTWMGNSTNYAWVLFNNQEVIGWFKETAILKEADVAVSEKKKNYKDCICMFIGIWDSCKTYFFKYDSTQLRLLFLFNRSYKVWFVNEFSFLFFLSPFELILFYYKYYHIYNNLVNNIFLSNKNKNLGVCGNLVNRSHGHLNMLLDSYSLYLPKEISWALLAPYKILLLSNENRFINFILFFFTWISYVYSRFMGIIHLLVTNIFLVIEQPFFDYSQYQNSVYFYYNINYSKKYQNIIISRFVNLFISESTKISNTFTTKTSLRGFVKSGGGKRMVDYEINTHNWRGGLITLRDHVPDHIYACQVSPSIRRKSVIKNSKSLATYYSHFFYKFCEVSEIWDKFFDNHVMVNNNIFLRSERITHNVEAELCWTFIPILFLIGMGIPSMGYLYFEDGFYINPIMSIKATGNQWYWTYQYNMLLSMSNEYRVPLFQDENINYLKQTVGHKDGMLTPGMKTFEDLITKNMEIKEVAEFYDISFQSHMVKESDLDLGGLRLLEVDQRLILPIRAMVRLGVTSVDVIHSWAVPALGKKLDGLPGRLNVSSIYISIPGVYYGQCSEICGIDHAFMPIVVEGVETVFFMRWLDFMQFLCSGDDRYYSYEDPNIYVYTEDEIIPLGVLGSQDGNYLAVRYSYIEEITVPW